MISKVSVCIATYNQAPYIGECVLSVLAQAEDSNMELEILVGDDHSTDGTGEILRMLDRQNPGRLTLVLRPSNIGGTQNYQDLVRRASGDFIAHLDGDDAWLQGKLAAQIRILQDHPECPAVYTNAVVVDAAGRHLGRFTNAQPQMLGLAYLAAKGNFLMHSSLVYRATLRDAFLGVRPPVIDYLIHLRLAGIGPLAFIDKELAMYRHGTPTSAVRNTFPRIQQLLWQALETSLVELGPQERRQAATHFAATILLAQMQGKFGSAQSLIGEVAAKLAMSHARLVVCSVPAALSIASHAIWRRLQVRLGTIRGFELHARI